MKIETLIKQRQKIINTLEVGSMAILFAGDLVKRSADSTYPFVVNRNFYYLTHCDEDSLICIFLHTGAGKKEVLFIKDFNSLEEKWVGHSLPKEEAAALSGIINIHPLSQFESFLVRTLTNSDIKTVYIDSERINLKHRSNEAENFAKMIQEKYPTLALINLNPSINALRRIKDKDEIEHIREAIGTTHRALNRVIKEMRVGRTEYQVAADFSYQLGLENRVHSFDTIAASGKDATILHYVTNQKVLKDGDLVLLDCGAACNNYSADITRTYPINGKFSPRQKELYTIVLKAQEAVIDAIKPGVSFQFLNEIVKEIYRQECVKAKVILSPDQIDEVYYHGVSHSLGLDTHDVGSIEGTLLEAGMVITVEPGLYSQLDGIGIRIEDDVLVTSTGCENLSRDIPKSIEAIESLFSLSKG